MKSINKTKKYSRLKGGKYKKKKIATRKRIKLKARKFKKTNRNKMNLMAKKSPPHTRNL